MLIDLLTDGAAMNPNLMHRPRGQRADRLAMRLATLLCALPLACSGSVQTVLAPPAPVAQPAPVVAAAEPLVELPLDEIKARTRLAIALNEEAEWRAALDHLELLRKARRNWVVELEYARAVYRLNGSIDEVRAALGRSLEYNPENPRALVMLGQLHEDVGEVVEAEAYYRRALSIREDELLPHESLARVLRRVGKPEEAVAVLERVIEQRGTSVRMLIQLAAAQEDAGHLDDARHTFELIARDHQDRIKGATLLYRFLVRQGDTKGAKRVEARIAELSRKKNGGERSLRPLQPSKR